MIQPATEVEESILASMLFDKDLAYDAVDMLNPKDFSNRQNGATFWAFSQVLSKNQSIDITLVVDLLRNKGWLDKAGGAARIVEISDKYPPVLNITASATAIIEKQRRKDLITAAAKISARANDTATDITDAINESQREILEIDTIDTGQENLSAADIIADELQPMHERMISADKYSGGMQTGFVGMDKIIGWMGNGELAVIAARPSMGKTALMLCIAKNILRQGIPCGIFSLEMPGAMLLQRMVATEANINTNLFRGKLSEKHISSLHYGYEQISNLPLYIKSNGMWCASDIWRFVRRMIRHNGIKCLFVDYLQKVLPEKGMERSRADLQVGRTIQMFKEMAKEFDLPVVLISKLNRDCEKRENKRPQLSDLAESGAIEYESDIIAFLYRQEMYNRKEPGYSRDHDEDKNKAEINFAKTRDGQTGLSMLTFFPEIMKFADMAKEY